MTRYEALWHVVANWRIRRRLPRLRALAVKRGLIAS